MTIIALTDRNVVTLGGPDARQLLHNVLTADMDQVDRDGIAYGGLLTPQGKIICDFLIHRGEDQTFHIDIRKEATQDFIRKMTLYRLRADVTISEPDDDLGIFAALNGMGIENTCFDPRLADLGHRFVAPMETTLSVNVDVSDLAAYHQHRIRLAIPEGGLDYSFGDTFPHDAAMDELHGIDFEKGCYVGQEVVSRMVHRGTARRRIMAVAADGVLPGPGAEIFAGTRLMGHLGSASQGDGIAIVRLDRLAKASGDGIHITVDGVPVILRIPDWASYTLEQFAA